MSVALNPGDNYQAITTAQPAGTTFLLSAGTFTAFNVTPKAGNQYIGVGPATILDGLDVTQYAFKRSGSGPADVVIDSMKIDRYVAASAMGPILAGGDAPSEGTTGWIVRDVEVTRSHNLGIRLGHSMQLIRVNMHHNATLGFGGVGNDSIIDTCTSAYNNVGTSNGDSGGCKIVLSLRTIVRNSWFHHNNGPGIWYDIANDSILVDNNLVEDNVQEGIVTEIGFGGRIRRNRVFRCGLDDSRSAGWAWGAGIAAHASGGTGLEVDNNFIEGCSYGMAWVQQPRGLNHSDPTAKRSDNVGLDTEQYCKNLNFHHNTVVMKSYSGHLNAGSFGAFWAVDDSGTSGLFLPGRNNVADNNTYFMRAADTAAFAYNNGVRNTAYWQATAGKDASGVFKRQLASYRPGDA